MKDTSLICSYRDDIIKYLMKKYPKARREDIEDVVQSAIIKATLSFKQWRGETSLKNWLTKIAVNSYIEIYRKSYMKNESLINSDDMNSVFENMIQEDFSETLCENNYLISLYNELMSGLEDNTSVITFNLNVIDDIDYKDIATKQNISVQAVKSRVHRGKMLLQKKYRKISYKYEESTV
jgi:RNA polymerase sigma-70 factor (ECF subfamily)